LTQVFHRNTHRLGGNLLTVLEMAIDGRSGQAPVSMRLI
jgi:hypothetical protein